MNTPQDTQTLGKVALDTYYGSAEHVPWDELDEASKRLWTAIAQAVASALMNKMAVSAEDVRLNFVGPVAFTDWPQTSANTINALLRSRLTKVQPTVAAQGKEVEWEEFCGWIGRKRGWTKQDGDEEKIHGAWVKVPANEFGQDFCGSDYRRPSPAVVEQEGGLKDIRGPQSGSEPVVTDVDHCQVCDVVAPRFTVLSQGGPWKHVCAECYKQFQPKRPTSAPEVASTPSEQERPEPPHPAEATPTKGEQIMASVRDEMAAKPTPSYRSDECNPGDFKRAAEATGKTANVRIIEGMAFNFEDGFICPECGGSHFGSTSDTTNGRFRITERQCHDEFSKGCKWHGEYYMASDLFSMARDAKTGRKALTAANEQVAQLKEDLEVSRKDCHAAVSRMESAELQASRDKSLLEFVKVQYNEASTEAEKAFRESISGRVLISQVLDKNPWIKDVATQCFNSGKLGALAELTSTKEAKEKAEKLAEEWKAEVSKLNEWRDRWKSKVDAKDVQHEKELTESRQQCAKLENDLRTVNGLAEMHMEKCDKANAEVERLKGELEIVTKTSESQFNEIEEHIRTITQLRQSENVSEPEHMCGKIDELISKVQDAQQFPEQGPAHLEKLIELFRKLREQIIRLRKFAHQRLRQSGCGALTAKDIWQHWYNGMVIQNRPVAPERSTWDDLPEREKNLDEYIARKLNSLLKSPWCPVSPSTMPTEADVDRNGNVLWIYASGEVVSCGWNDPEDWSEKVAMPTHWRHTNLPPLPEPAKVEMDGFVQWMEKQSIPDTIDKELKGVLFNHYTALNQQPNSK